MSKYRVIETVLGDFKLQEWARAGLRGKYYWETKETFKTKEEALNEIKSMQDMAETRRLRRLVKAVIFEGVI